MKGFVPACRECSMGLVGPGEFTERVARRILRAARSPRVALLAQPIRGKPLFVLNLLSSVLADGLVAWVIATGETAGPSS